MIWLIIFSDSSNFFNFTLQINNFDNVLDVDVVDSKSKFLKLENKILTNYTELKKFAENQYDMFDKDEEGISCYCGD